MKKTDAERIKKIGVIWNALQHEIVSRGITEELLLKDEFFQWAVTTPLYNIGEQVYQISSETKQAHPEIPWRTIYGLRNRIVHDYEGVNMTLIWEIISDDLPELLEKLNMIR